MQVRQTVVRNEAHALVFLWRPYRRRNPERLEQNDNPQLVEGARQFCRVLQEQRRRRT